jgi:hypothetical protein
VRINRSLLGWGVFFVVLGAVPLAVRQGLVPEEAVARAWALWPLLLIFAGIGLVLRRTSVAPVASLAMAATFGLIGGGFLASGSIPGVACGDQRREAPFQPQSGQLASEAEVDVQILCGDLNVSTAAGTGWSIDGTDDDGRGPRIDASPSGLEVRADRDADFFRGRNEWRVVLPTDVQLAVDAEVNAGVAHFVLRDANVSRFELHANASQPTVDLGEVAAIDDLEVELNAAGQARIVFPSDSLTGSITANASRVRLCVPPDVGLRLTGGDSVASSHNYAERGLVRQGDAWQTTNFDTATAQIELRTQANAGSFDLEPEDACDA